MTTRFKPGQSGNPAGRPKNSGLSAQLRKAIADEAGEILQSVIEQAKSGDIQAAKLLLDRVLPPLKSEAQAVQLDLASGDLVAKANTIIEATGTGELAPDIAAQLIAAVATLAKVIEVNELEQRLETLEQRLPNSEAKR